MKIPKIIYNDKILNKISWFGFVKGVTFLPYIILKEEYNSSAYYKNVAKKLINHESIHIKQQSELLVIIFYVLYLLEFMIRFILSFDRYESYNNISFEREAKINEGNLDYIKTRKFWAWIKYL